ncbi:manganese efflux pump MntP [Alicyclobacillus sp. ALC3]|uniref:manganese efflux pump MntP n=1 Tax=Alicyclobacillus sp. ALC3 TaxID=2796143 RepID=UPI0023791ADD|nr:manganese efflux pump [Alicyclobacillus sp. ALC3]WDL95988.1 manganese efflux pump [Alicyclobacillus sp. ALC3]
MSWQLVMLALALALNNSIAAIALGSAGISRKRQFATAVLFALFEALMPVLGVALGEGAARLIGAPARYAGIVVLVGAGVYSLLQMRTDSHSETKHDLSGFRLVVLSVAMSLDNLTVGFGLGMFHVSLVESAFVFGAVSLVMTFVGLELGRWIGRAVRLSTDLLTGLVLIATAGLMLFR